MNLLYVWNEAYSNTNRNAGYQLSSRYQITFIKKEGTLSIRRRESLSEGEFWEEHIYDVMAVVGNNGAGKTQLACCIMATLDEADALGERRIPFLLVFEDNQRGNPKIKIFSNNLKFSVDTALQCDRAPSRDDLRRFKFVYFTDTLSLLDYEWEKHGVVWDNSLGGAIRRAYKHSCEMHYIGSTVSPIINYFDDEMWRVLEFARSNQNQKKIPFALPKTADFSAKLWQTNLEYIAKELRDMGRPDGQEILVKKCSEMERVYGLSLCSKLAIHLMLNLFKTACIPQTTSEDLREQADKFLEIISQTGCQDETALDMMVRLMERLKQTDNRNVIPPYMEMVLWLKKQSALQSSGNWETWTLNLSKDQQTIDELYHHYRETSFSYPYLLIHFELSTGEYALLRRFTRINELLDHQSNGKAYVTNNIEREVECDGLMLWFDEADQSMHPEWQRTQLDWLLQFISRRFVTCETQLVMATHSPIMLSDIPREHVLYLRNIEGETQVEQREVRTFGSNIHTLFRDAFFLSKGTMGAFAERKINGAAHELQDSDGQASPKTRRLIEAIGDDVIRNKLRQMQRTSSTSDFRPADRSAVEETIHLLRSQVEHLEAIIRRLERVEYDKN